MILDLKGNTVWGIPGNGYPYSGIDRADTDFIYLAISALPAILSSEVFEFDISKYFIKPEKAIKQLDDDYDSLLKNKTKLITLKEKYSNKGLAPYPIEVCLQEYEKIIDIFEVVLSLDEIMDFKRKNNTIMVKEANKYDVVIITALHETEFEALLKLPVELKKINIENDSTDYRNCVIGNVSVLMATDDKMGMTAAATLSTKLISKFSPKYLIMSGIAGGIKTDSNNYGDILVSRYSFNYESGKYKYKLDKKQTVFEPNPEQVEISSDLVPSINLLISDKTLLEKISLGFVETSEDKKPNTILQAYFGPIASGSAVVADSRKIEDIKAGQRKLIGIDMETFSVIYAAQKFSTIPSTKAISIKSISDFADQKKSDKYRKYAAYTSANFIYHLILTELQNS